MRITDEELKSIAEPLEKLRNLITNELQATLDEYHPLDLQRIKEDNRFLARFLIHKKSNIGDALFMIKGALLWRKSFNVHGITKDSIPIEYFNTNSVIPFHNDKQGNHVLILRVKEYRKIPDMENATQRFLIYWLEKMDKQSDSGQITVIFNCKGCGLSNLDMDLIKFLVTVFRNYYPLCLAHILVYEMPWLYNTAWRLIKTWLPEDAVEKVKLVNQESILEYIDHSHLPIEMGGVENLELSSFEMLEKDTEESQQNSTQENHFEEPLLQITPSDKLVFESTETTNVVTLSISNVSKSCVAYKIKTTNRQSYRVLPFCGFIQPGDRVDVSAQLISGAVCQDNDKFLILATKVNNNASLHKPDQIWSSHSQILEYKIKCVTVPLKKPENVGRINELAESIELKKIENKLNQIEETLVATQGKQMVILYLGLFLLMLNLFLDHRVLLYSFLDELIN